ncbi:ATP-dependent zinc metalloprotease FtsH [Microbacterium lemovicicum]|uniref:ATP-dependent zinc metalloprotease FtsH n=1 Tax=Microbacterium lemovicicum TaxID=1072463 RepID=A0A3S9WEM0_9MICO|nr:ATP-binding protein [Microbacterium lemovicicum]AZS38492.1 ATP-dependent zinc metalloprotease FtsH [Microbacterium lemovicicum]
MDQSSDERALLHDLRSLVARLNEMPDERAARVTPLGERVNAHLGVDAASLPLVRESIASHRLVDVDLALEELAATDPRAELLGIEGGQERQHEDFAGLLRHRFSTFSPDGPVEYQTSATGFGTSRQTVTAGIRLLHFHDKPVAVLQRGAARMFGRENAELVILTADPATTAAVVEHLRRRMNELSVVRGNIVTFAKSDDHDRVGRMVFLERPGVAAADVVLPTGLLTRVRDHVVGIGENAVALRSLGQHLKRGLLLYGPPGTGKTLTVRHLLHETPGTTAVLLQGMTLGAVGEAVRLARAMTPSIVVLEDVDLVASDRMMFGGPQPLLFEILDALDGLDGDADVAFVLTTNRAEILEPALAARPGRIDLAVEVPLPDATARRELFRIYGSGVDLSADALDAAADRADGVTASFAKELIRRVVLRAAVADRAPTDADLDAALTEMMEAAEGIAHVLFGGRAAAGVDPGERGGEPSMVAWSPGGAVAFTAGEPDQA